MFAMMSYSINFEDVILQRAFPRDYQGFYIDVGASYPVEQSDTKHFERHGWRGINIEPNPTPFAVLQADRPRDVNLNIGLSNKNGQMSIYETPGACWSVVPEFLTGYYNAAESNITEHTIEIRTLAEICDTYVPAGTPIDFLKIDVEGHELAVIQGADWARYRPKVVLIEATGWTDWDHLLLEAGYHFTLFDGVNRFYVRDEDKHLVPILSTPANAGDCFSIHGYARLIDQLNATIAERSTELERARQELQQVHDHYRQYSPASLAVARRVGQASQAAHGLVHRLKRGA